MFGGSHGEESFVVPGDCSCGSNSGTTAVVGNLGDDRSVECGAKCHDSAPSRGGRNKSE